MLDPMVGRCQSALDFKRYGYWELTHSRIYHQDLLDSYYEVRFVASLFYLSVPGPCFLCEYSRC